MCQMLGILSTWANSSYMFKATLEVLIFWYRCHFQQWCPCLYRSSDTPERSCWFIMICILFGNLFCVVRWGQRHVTSVSQWNTRVIKTKAVVPLVFSWHVHQPHSCLCSNATHSSAPSSSLYDWFFPFECTFSNRSHFSFASLSNILCSTNNIVS